MTCQTCGANWVPSAEAVRGHGGGSGSELATADYVWVTRAVGAWPAAFLGLSLQETRLCSSLTFPGFG